MKIKILARGIKEGSSEFEYKPGYVFTFDPLCIDYDWLVVYDEMPTEDVGVFKNGYEELRCPKECTILATTEPISIKRYSRSYTRQFAHLLTNRPPEAEKHPGYFLGRGYYHWYIGRSFEEYKLLIIPPKQRLISVISSSKQMRHTKHAARYKLAEELSKNIPDIDWFGHGVRGFEKKYEVLEPYKYHVTIENHIGKYHWSEKLSDVFLAECLPFYAGDPAADEIFPKESFIPIPIDDPKAAADIIKTAIANQEYEKRRDAIFEAKRLILEKYNFSAQVIEVIEKNKNQKITSVETKRPVRIYERKALRKRNIFVALSYGYFHLKDEILRIFKR